MTTAIRGQELPKTYFQELQGSSFKAGNFKGWNKGKT
jgi:hypothetical protein